MIDGPGSDVAGFPSSDREVGVEQCAGNSLDVEGSSPAKGVVRLTRERLLEAVRGAWESVIGEWESADQNFFAAGGNSFLAAQLAGHLSNSLELSVRVSLVLDNQTGQGLARALEELCTSTDLPCSSASTYAELKPWGRRGSVRTSMNQLQRLLRDRRDEQNYGARRLQHVSIGLRIRGAIDLGRIQATLRRTGYRYDVLRSRFPEPWEVIIASGPTIELNFFDVSADDDPLGSAIGIAAAVDDAPFDLTTGPCWRAAAIKTAPEDTMLVLTFDHLLLDGWSLRTIRHELISALEGGDEADYGSAAIADYQYYDWSDWQWARKEDGTFDLAMSEWKEKLSEEEPIPELHLADAHQVSRRVAPCASSSRRALSKSALNALYLNSSAYGVTPYSYVLAAYVRALRQFCASGAISGIVVPVANRSDSRLHSMVGWMSNLSIVATWRTGSSSFRDLARDISGQLRDLEYLAVVPFAELVARFQPDRHTDGRAHPLAYFDLTDSELFPVADRSRSRVEPFEFGSAPGLAIGYSLFAERSPSGDISLIAQFDKAWLPEGCSDSILAAIEGEIVGDRR